MYMDWSDVGKKIISVGAPLLGGALGGPAGAAIGQVIASQFGLTEASPDKVLEAITADPEARLKLTELEFRHSERLIELENEYFKLQTSNFKLQTEDVQQARNIHQHHWMPSAITMIMSAMFGAIVGSLFMWAIPEGNKDIVVYMAGQVSGILTSCVTYWVGSTRASTNKDSLIRR